MKDQSNPPPAPRGYATCQEYSYAEEMRLLLDVGEPAQSRKTIDPSMRPTQRDTCANEMSVLFNAGEPAQSRKL